MLRTNRIDRSEIIRDILELIFSEPIETTHLKYTEIFRLRKGRQLMGERDLEYLDLLVVMIGCWYGWVGVRVFQLFF